MALRSKTMTKGPDPEEPAQELFSQRRRPETGQFLLQVDRQTKASFSTYEAAEAAGLVRAAASHNPSGRGVTDADYTILVRWLASPEAEFIQGQVIFVNGGANLSASARGSALF